MDPPTPSIHPTILMPSPICVIDKYRTFVVQKTKECTYPSQLPVSHEGLVCINKWLCCSVFYCSFVLIIPLFIILFRKCLYVFIPRIVRWGSLKEEFLNLFVFVIKLIVHRLAESNQFLYKKVTKFTKFTDTLMWRPCLISWFLNTEIGSGN